MNYTKYLHFCEEIIASEKPETYYNDPLKLSFIKLNYTRMKRWSETLTLNTDIIKRLQTLTSAQKWIILTEPWCGDAAAIVPFLVKLTEQSPMIEYDLMLRDSPPFLINDYLTNGTMSIPKLIVRNTSGEDIFTWGPRPLPAQQLVTELKHSGTDFDTLKLKLQNWYNIDKGNSLQQELMQLLIE